MTINSDDADSRFGNKLCRHELLIKGCTVCLIEELERCSKLVSEAIKFSSAGWEGMTYQNHSRLSDAVMEYLK